jgi:hypothetical protein
VSAAYAVFAILCAATAWARRKDDAVMAHRDAKTGAAGGPLHAWQMLRWAAYAACASTLLIAVTNHLTREVAPIPLLWVMPLGVYLATFVLLNGEAAGTLRYDSTGVWMDVSFDPRTGRVDRVYSIGVMQAK